MFIPDGPLSLGRFMFHEDEDPLRVPRSMFTTFRCLSGQCDSDTGGTVGHWGMGIFPSGILGSPRVEGSDMERYGSNQRNREIVSKYRGSYD